MAQSGISKRLDQAAGNDLLSKIAAMLGRAEKQIAELALLVLDNGTARGRLASRSRSTTPPSSTSSLPRSWPAPSPSSRTSWPPPATRPRPRASCCAS